MIADQNIPSTPYFLANEEKFLHNAKKLASIANGTGCILLHSLKAFSSFRILSLLKKYIDGFSCSSYNEVILASELCNHRDFMSVYSAAYPPKYMSKVDTYADFKIFNSLLQWNTFKELNHCTEGPCKYGLRLNPEYSEVKNPLYNCCTKDSRFGITADDLNSADLEYISGFHVHCLCGSTDASEFERVTYHFEKTFSEYVGRDHITWLNLGGGSIFTHKDYDVRPIIKIINELQIKYNLRIIIEPGEALGYEAGVLVTTVLDVIRRNSLNIAIVDTSAAVHIPDILEAPYTPSIEGASRSPSKKYKYRVDGVTCMAGDIIGTFNFDFPLEPGDQLVIEDMMPYTMVKTNHFNGIDLPSFWLETISGKLELIASYDYKDFRSKAL